MRFQNRYKKFGKVSCLVWGFICFYLSFPTWASEFIGSDSCQSCHQSEFEQWKTSHHYHAMAEASEQSVLGDFNDVTFPDEENKVRFFRKGEEFWVHLKGPEGEYSDYQISYTFGYKPLQQYLVDFPDGKKQAIPYSWDSRPKHEGGQRWFNLYPQFNKLHQDFYWTNYGQNWNFMCADCHSTNLEKKFNSVTKQYETSWSEINVGCEACHGPAAKHIAWTDGNNKQDPLKGFERNLQKPVTQWLRDGSSLTANASGESLHSDQLNTCGQCHSRHTQINESDHVKSGSLLNRYILSLVNGEQYYPDGSLYDETYVLGSFLQSKMHQEGVVCSNCHNPHSGELVLPKQQVCLQCHDTSYAATSHHNHQSESEGAVCVNCHMPETLYMQVDKRADHRFGIPRPDLSLISNAPDTCLNCHADKDSHWSNSQVLKWFPESTIRDRKDFSEAFFKADQRILQSGSELSRIAQDYRYSDIIRASALERMSNYPDPNSLIGIARAAKSDNELMRLGAVRGSQNLPPIEKWRLISPLLQDGILAVRIEAARILSVHWAQMNDTEREAMGAALQEYLDSLEFNADRAFSHTNKGNLFVALNRYDEAMKAYNDAIEREPYFPGAYIAKAELYRLQGMEEQAIAALQEGIEAQPEAPMLHFSLGLAKIRQKNYVDSLSYFETANELAPQNGYFKHVYSLALEKVNPQRAIEFLKQDFVKSQSIQGKQALCEMAKRYQVKEALCSP